MTAIFSFSSWVTVILLFICACTYLHIWQDPGQALRGQPGKYNGQGMIGLLWKAARVGERLSPYVSVACFFMAFHTLFLS